MSADAYIRSRFGGLEPGVEFDRPRLTEAPPLADATVALVTTAALMRPGEPWQANTHAYRSFSPDENDLIVGHNSTNFDRVGVAADLNVAFPVDRLGEMAADGTIGAVAPLHLSFLGSTFDLATFMLDTGPAAAKELLDAGVDVVLLTPV